MLVNVMDAIRRIIDIEGGYSNHPSDKGGETKYGITSAVARAFGYSGLMRDLPLQVAEDIYLQRYWIEPKFEKIAYLSQSIAEELFDTGVNMGQSTAVKFLQRCLNVLNKEGVLYPDLNVDGSIGSMTIQALKIYLEQRGKEGEKVLLKMLNALQSVRYIEIAEKSPSQEAFEYGWQKERVA